MVAVPAAGAVTVHCTELPTTLSPLTKPVPENPVWFDSTTPWEIVASSASNRVAAEAGLAVRAVTNEPATTARTAVRAARRDLRNLIDPPGDGGPRSGKIGPMHGDPTKRPRCQPAGHAGVTVIRCH